MARFVGSGIAVLDGWYFYPEFVSADEHAPLEDFTRLTHFNDYEGGKASNPVISTDGRFMAFQSARTTDPAEFSRLGLEDPATDKNGTANLLRVLDGDGKPIVAVIVGHRRMRTQGNVPETIFIRSAEADSSHRNTRGPSSMILVTSAPTINRPP